MCCRGLDIRVSQIVKANAAKAVMLPKNWKLRRDIPRLDALTDLIDIDVLQIVRVALMIYRFLYISSSVTSVTSPCFCFSCKPLVNALFEKI